MSIRCSGTCKRCGRSAEDLHPCNNCSWLICSSCRCGTGSVSDGYECIVNCGFPRMKIKVPIPKPHLLKGLTTSKWGPTVVAILVGCLLGSFLIWFVRP